MATNQIQVSDELMAQLDIYIDDATGIFYDEFYPESARPATREEVARMLAEDRAARQ